MTNIAKQITRILHCTEAEEGGCHRNAFLSTYASKQHHGERFAHHAVCQMFRISSTMRKYLSMRDIVIYRSAGESPVRLAEKMHICLVCWQYKCLIRFKEVTANA